MLDIKLVAVSAKYLPIPTSRFIWRTMASPGNAQKRKLSTDRPISPPPLRRKVHSTTTKTDVASFFTPTSQKPPEKISWQERAPDEDSPSTLLVGKFEPLNSSDKRALSHNLKRNKVAAFDFDSTLIQTSSGKKHPTNGQDWKWWHPSVPTMLRKLYLDDGFCVVVISNQAGISLKTDPKPPKARLAEFKSKVSAVFNHINIPVSIYVATEKDIYRKPRMGMWKELLEDYDIHLPGDLKLQESIFVGDAAGRHASTGKSKDFSCSDRNFAENVGIKFYTPEEYFLDETPRSFTRTFEPGDYSSENTTVSPKYKKDNPKDIVILCGSPGAGKSTFYWKQLEPLGYSRVNQDILKTKRDRCFKVAGQYLDEGRSVVVDNTNADRDVRSKWIALAAKHSVPIRCVHFLTSVQVCEHNDAVRALNETMNPEKRKILPKLAFTSFTSRYQRPELIEGFQDITEVPFKFEGSEAQRGIWTQHWI
ncbi:putative polynucleotide kinase 3 phosphatase protein [Botrytis cinerea BcDW1]|uniref:Putative polynucleotide kinase 3 phosphatase protein n=1 Tax=Botryotinia fuckeliana (strain BcDW1) TaxID=1290391 RepID=M7UT98_BOTF1|nr:putative polynucleotide kinase 3 phosphatase protein [Botrytis cinerea BcDW1]